MKKRLLAIIQNVFSLHYPSAFSFLFVTAAWFSLQAQGLEITDFKTPSVSCDYLIICPSEFLPSALTLAAFRNTYTLDDVENAKVVTIDTIYKEFPIADTEPACFHVWYALKYANEQWSIKPRYVVFMGDDSLKITSFDSCPQSAGLVPTFFESADTIRNISGLLDTGVAYTDFLYATVAETIPPVARYNNQYNFTTISGLAPGFVYGRIPAQTAYECSVYVDKVIRYEPSQNNGPWWNNIIANADDAFQGVNPDPIDHMHLQSSDRVADGLLHGFFVNKIYLSSFTKDTHGSHTNTKKAFFAAVNTGARWSIYFGHGNPDSLSDEGFLRNSEAPLFTNDSMPTMFFSFSCENGDFRRKTQSQMCKTYLFRPYGGCIAYIAATVPTMPYPNEQLAQSIFSHSNSDEPVSLGHALLDAQMSDPNNNNSFYYNLLGDPALLFCKNRDPLSATLTALTNGSISVSCEAKNVSSKPLYYHYEISLLDTIHCLDDSSVTYVSDSVVFTAQGSVAGAIQTLIPALLGGKTVKYTVYVWNDETEGRLDSIFVPVPSSVRHLLSQETARSLFRFVRNSLILNIPSSFKDNNISISVFDMKGSQIKKIAMSGTNNQSIINFNTLRMTEGNYLLYLKVGNVSFSRKICYLR